MQNDLLVPLERFSPTLVENVFLRIEEPEHPRVFPVAAAAQAAPQTIGQFYAQIAKVIQDAVNRIQWALREVLPRDDEFQEIPEKPDD